MKKIFFLLFLLLPAIAYGQKGTLVPNTFEITAPKSLDARTGKFSSGAWIPYATTSEANAAIPSTRRHVGLTVCIGTTTTCTEYWYSGGIADGHLVLKFAGGGGSGTVTSVGMTVPSGFNVSGSPITGSGTFAITAPGNASTQYINGAGGASLVSNLPISTATQTALDLKANLISPTLVTPNLGTPTAGVLTNVTGTATGLTAGTANALKSASGVVSTSAATAPTSGQVLTATSGTTATWQTPTGGSSGASRSYANIVCVGTSITRGTGSDDTALHSYPGYMQTFYGRRVVVNNKGAGGSKTSDWVTSPSLSVIAGAYDSLAAVNILNVELGTNNFYPTTTVSLAQTKIDIDSIVRYSRRIGYKVVLALPAEAEHNYTLAYNVYEHPEFYQFAQWGRENQSTLKLSGIVDLINDPYVGQYRTDYAADYWEMPTPGGSVDYVHYGNLGYYRMAILFKEADDNIISSSMAYTLAQPDSVYVDAANTVDTLDWNRVHGAEKYQVYWNDSFDYQTAALLTTTVDTHYVHTGLTNDAKYYYFVRATSPLALTSTYARNDGVPNASEPGIKDTILHSNGAWTYNGGLWADNGTIHYMTSNAEGTGNAAEIDFNNGIAFPLHAGFGPATYVFQVDGDAPVEIAEGGHVGHPSAYVDGEIMFEVHPNDAGPHTLYVWRKTAGGAIISVRRVFRWQ